MRDAFLWGKRTPSIQEIILVDYWNIFRYASVIQILFFFYKEYGLKAEADIQVSKPNKLYFKHIISSTQSSGMEINRIRSIFNSFSGLRELLHQYTLSKLVEKSFNSHKFPSKARLDHIMSGMPTKTRAGTTWCGDGVMQSWAYEQVLFLNLQQYLFNTFS